jgi:NAD-dependent deacetylase
MTGAQMRRERQDAVGVLLAQAHSALVITGSQLSEEAGIPTYRGVIGVELEKPEEGRVLQAALSTETLQRKPEMTWKYVLRMEAAMRLGRPTAAHEFISSLQTVIPRVVVLTTNTDRLHQRAGSKHVIEMHGTLYELRCTRCELLLKRTKLDDIEIPPRCRACNSVLRPAMALFGESLAAEPLEELQRELDLGFDIVIAAGVTTMLPYLARPILLARSEGMPTVEIGETTTDVSDIVDIRLKGSPTAILESIGQRHVAERSLTRRPRSRTRG